MLKLTDNPPITPDLDVSVADLAGTWWIAYTKARFEKALAWDLFGHGIGYFLPMKEKVIFSGGRKRTVMAPLFTSYVFICGEEADRVTTLTTNRISSIINVSDQRKLAVELSAIQRALIDKVIIDSYPHLAVGARCRVKSGPLMGTVGVVIRKNSERARMVLEVTMLGQGALIEVDSDLLEAADS